MQMEKKRVRQRRSIMHSAKFLAKTGVAFWGSYKAVPDELHGSALGQDS
jgi:hypothetical protein